MDWLFQEVVFINDLRSKQNRFPDVFLSIISNFITIKSLL